MNSLKAACKVRQLVVQTSEGHGTRRKADFFHALLTWVRTNGAVIAAFEVAHGPGQPPEASQAWWCQYDALQDPQGLKFCLGASASWDDVLTQWKVLRETPHVQMASRAHFCNISLQVCHLLKDLLHTSHRHMAPRHNFRLTPEPWNVTAHVSSRYQWMRRRQ